MTPKFQKYKGKNVKPSLNTEGLTSALTDAYHNALGIANYAPLKNLVPAPTEPINYNDTSFMGFSTTAHHALKGILSNITPGKILGTALLDKLGGVIRKDYTERNLKPMDPSSIEDIKQIYRILRENLGSQIQ